MTDAPTTSGQTTSTTSAPFNVLARRASLERDLEDTEDNIKAKLAERAGHEEKSKACSAALTELRKFRGQLRQALGMHETRAKKA